MPFPLPSILIPAIPSDAAYQLALLICHDRPTGDPSHSIRRRLSSHSAGIPLLQQFDVPPCSADTEGIHMQDAYFLIISGLQ